MTENEINKLLHEHINNECSGTATVTVDGGVRDVDVKECGSVFYHTPKDKILMKLPTLGTKEETIEFADKTIDQLIIAEEAIESIQSHTENERSKINKELLTHINKSIHICRGSATAAEDVGRGMCGPVTYCTPEGRGAMKLPTLGTKEETIEFADKTIDQLIIIERGIESIQSHIDKGAHND